MGGMLHIPNTPYKALWNDNLLWRGTWFTSLDNTLMSPRLAPFACILILREITFHLLWATGGTAIMEGKKVQKKTKRGSAINS